ncbi:MAG: YqcC family protein [Motiliproteus sp.]|nr:YqcC family protein [Motiliproteus sp.]MCW9050760.1 YqcC family protein [Motiliproteus sp.]
MIKDRNKQVQQLLADIEQQLIQLDLWRSTPPSAEALVSTEPFCVDTLALSEWLQWVLIPRMCELIQRQMPLPGNCNIHAIAEESFKELNQDYSQLMQLIKDFDESLTVRH